MTNLIKTEGIIINKQDIGEFDRIITMFTGGFGKIDILVKGIRKSRKRDKLGSDILSFSRTVVYKKENNFVGSTVETIKSYENIRGDMKRIGTVLYMFHVLNNILADSERKTVLYDLTLKSLDYIDREENISNCILLVIYYLNKIIGEEGIKFTIEGGRNFSVKNSVISEEFYSDTVKLSREEYHIIESIYFNRVKKLLKENTNVRDLYSVLSIYERYLNYHMELCLDFKNYILEA